MNENDAYMKMMTEEVIQASSYDIQEDEAWMKSHGFFQSGNEDGFPKYVNRVFSFGELAFEVALVVDMLDTDDAGRKVEKTWACQCNTNLMNLICSLSYWMHEITSGAQVSYVTRTTNDSFFDMEIEKSKVIQNLFAIWLVNFKQTGGTPQEALEKYCVAVIDAFDQVKKECKSHSRSWWNKNWIGR